MLTAFPFRLSYGPGDDRLRAFYIPALRASVRYDRMTGYFSSSALAVAAAGVAGLIANGGQMRLLVGAQLSPEDVEAIRQGHDLREVVASALERSLPESVDVQDRLMRDRLGALAWMVSQGCLEIRVVLPKGADGLPVAAPDSRDYFHPKVGVLADAQGNRLAFSGSVNESEMGWERNYEQFFVFRSWTEEGRLYVAEAAGRFERLWEQREPDWVSLSIPDAARQRLLRYAPAEPPLRDALEREGHRDEAADLAEARREERILAQFLRDAPYLVGATGLGAATSALRPYPHQIDVARRIVAAYPGRYLLADEVGLGKTIEAGLVLRQLWLSGIVRRALILAPRSVVRQWQEELYEKFALEVPFYDGSVLSDLWGDERVPSTSNPWDDAGLVLASSQLVKRSDRRQVLLEAQPWDLVMVDESHHARRRDFLDPEAYRPNRLLELLNALQARTRGLILMTATPMQVHPIEVWDLLTLLGLGGEWGADGRNLPLFFEELSRSEAEADWAFLFRMLGSELAARGGRLDSAVEARMQRELGPVDWQRVQGLLCDRDPAKALRRLPARARSAALTLIKEHTPLRRLVFRNTRELLREYVRKGLLREKVPVRDPRLVWIPMRPDERALYDRIEEYIAQFYRKYEGERKGLGFVMTVYRRRLTSSFFAVQRSLERRLAFLRGAAGLGLDEDDLEQEELTWDTDELGLDERATFRDEVEYVERFLHALTLLSGVDSKVDQLVRDLADVFRSRDTAIVFTQYTDTMDYLREQLRQTYGSQVACYSGRGGERWDGTLWVPVSKEEIKLAFRQGEEVKLLVCTEAASEGLNLQTCGVLINYDMPWNPMRVEQRIGRIDRIGQRYDQVWIRNYFYEDTVEARVYKALATRIDWFQQVIGPLQPILAGVSQVIQAVAMAPPAEQEALLEQAMARLRGEIEGGQSVLNLDESSGHAEGAAPLPESPVTLAALGEALTTAPTLKDRFRPHQEISGAFWLREGGRDVAVTFDAATFDEHPSTLRFLTYGSPLLAALLESIPAPASGETGPLLRASVEEPLRRVAYHALDEQGRPRRLNRLDDVRAILQTGGLQLRWTDAGRETAEADLRAAAAAEWSVIQEAESALAHVRRSARLAQAVRLLQRAALVELALGQQPALMAGAPMPAAFDDSAVRGLRRHGYPWAPLVLLAQSAIEAPRPTDPFFQAIQNEPADRLRRRFDALTQRAAGLLEALAASRSVVG